jgi:hypothetical protein
LKLALPGHWEGCQKLASRIGWGGLGILCFLTFPCGAPSWGAAGPSIDDKSQAEILQEADGLFREVSRLRGLPIKHPVQKEFKNQAFFWEYYLRVLQEQYPPEKKRNYEKAFAVFGFLPPETDLIQTYLDAFVGVVRGLYDPKSKTLYIADWIDSGEQEETLIHELDHALQDQYFDLQAYLDRGKNESMDAQFARSSVMEGEAKAIVLNYVLEDQGTDFTRRASIADWVQLSKLFRESGDRAFGRRGVLNDVVDFPYVYGASFLQKYVKAYGWEGMKNLFEHPPSSTRQIMHPETFFPKRRNPVKIRIEDLSVHSLRGFQKIWENTLGEYGLLLLLKRYLSETQARQSVDGWKGDSVQVYEKKDSGQLVLTGYVVFESDPSADRFFRSYQSLLNQKYPIDVFRRSDDTIYWASPKDGNGEVYVERFGRRVVFIEGSGPGQTERVRGALWDVVRAKPK